MTRWRLSADRTLTADIVSSKDRYGSGDISHVPCGRVTNLPNLLTCESSG